MATWADIIKASLMELGAVGQGETVSAEDSAWVLTKANRILDRWNAQRCAVYADVYTTYTCTPSLNPHTIGPSGTFVVTQRPVTIDGASLYYSSTVLVPLTLRDRDWFMAQTIPSLSTNVPTDLYYNPTWPNGSLHFYPVPSAASQVRLTTRTYLAQVATSDTFTLPPGYQDALTLTIAEEIAPSYNKQLDPRTLLSAQQARAIIFGNNDQTPRIMTQDAGLPGGGPGGWNYVSRSY